MFTTLISSYCKSINRLVYVVGLTSSWLMPLLALTVAFEVFSRYALNSPTIWAYDVSLFLFGYIAALIGALAQQKKSHIIVDVLYLSVPPRVRALFSLLSFSLAIFFLAIVILMSHGKFEEAIEFNYRRQSEWAPTMAHFWVMMMTACSLFILQLSSDMLQSLYFLTTGKKLSISRQGKPQAENHSTEKDTP